MQNDLRAPAPLIVFFVLWALLSALFESLIITFGFQRPFVIGVMWSVGVSAMLALKLTGRSLASLGWSWGPWRYHAIAYALPLAYALIAYIGAASLGLVQLGAPDAMAALIQGVGLTSLGPTLGFIATIAVLGAIGMVGAMSTALGEEIGWRGFLTPRLTTAMGFLGATLVTGAIWAAWHLPALWFSDYNAGGDKVAESACFVVMVIAISAPAAWLRLKSGSLWPAATLHAAHNLIIQSIFDPLTTRGANPITMVSEFGVVTAIVCVAVSIPFWVLGARLPKPTGATASTAPQPAS